jgi:hypothetical protein
MPEERQKSSRPRTATVTRAQVIAAKGKIATDKRQGKTTPRWVYAVAEATPRSRDR